MTGTRTGFSLIEMLVVIGILAILIGLGMTTFSGATRKAQQARAVAVVKDVATSLEAILHNRGAFPPKLLSVGESGGLMDSSMTGELGKMSVMSVSRNSSGDATGYDRCGIVTPWAYDLIKRDKTAKLSTPVPSGGLVSDHVVHFAVDVDGDGFVNAYVGTETLKIRAAAVAWCCGPDGKTYSYTEGVRHGCSFSWGAQQVENK